MPQPNRQPRKKTFIPPPTDAQIAAFRVGVTPQTIDADIQCGCGFIFRMVGIPAPDSNTYVQTSEWHPPAGASELCPACGRAHRVRSTVGLHIIEENRAAWEARIKQERATT